MRTLIQISDLHFGRIDPQVVTALRAFITDRRPDLVIVSGDLTQRARSHQFQEARTFLDTLAFPKLIVPGNHDIPLYDFIKRIFHPFSKYRRHFTEERMPIFEDAEIVVVGINSVKSFSWKDGILRRKQIEAGRSALARASERLKLVVTHHPLRWKEEPTSELVLSKPDVLLAGHLHIGSVEATAKYSPQANYSLVLVQAGTATSTRLRGEENSFNVLQIDSSALEVSKFSFDEAKGTFGFSSSHSFRKSEAGWLPL